MRSLLKFLNRILPTPLKSLLTKTLGAALFYFGYKPKQFHNTLPLRKLLNTSFFDYYFYKTRRLNSEELNNKFWKEWGAKYLASFNQTPIPEYYLKEIENLIETKNVKTVFELGCGFLRHLEHLANKYPHLELYGVDITPEIVDHAKALNNPHIKVFVDDVRNIEKYRDILKKAGLIFSYGIFAYLNPVDLEKVCGIIQKHFRGYVVYNDASQKRDLSELIKSIKLSSQSYIHPYPKIFKKYGLEEISSGYSPDKESFNFIGKQHKKNRC
ncbi:MAG: class I SAM-dependent methyltransferase [Candidatus Colwellbacteria bacterium]|nr:class I SAM-dependent methyltransferase [Candidatus Colwellbacteria bacterium]